jgi:predicted PurR-regulated permease PerM
MGWRIFLWLTIVLVVVGFLYLVRSILFPFAFGIFASALLDPAIRKLRLRGFSRTWAVLTVFVGFFVAVGTLVAVGAPRAAEQLKDIQEKGTGFIYSQVLPGPLIRFLGDRRVQEKMAAEEWPIDADAFKSWITDRTKDDSAYSAFFREMSSKLGEYSMPMSRSAMVSDLDALTRPGLIDKFFVDNQALLRRFNLPTSVEEAESKFHVRTRLESSIQNLVSSAFSGAASIAQYLASSLFLLIMTPIITLLFLFDYDNFRRRFVTWIPPAIRPSATDLMSDIGDVLGNYVRGLTISIALYAAVMLVVMLILGVPYSIFLALLFGVFYLIPYIGNFISMGLLFLAVVASGKQGTFFYEFSSPAAYGLFVVVIFLIVGTVWDQFVHPKIVGRSVGLNIIVSFFVVFAGAALFGLVGMILAFPIAGTVKVILDRLIRFTTTTGTGELDLPRLPSRMQA